MGRRWAASVSAVLAAVALAACAPADLQPTPPTPLASASTAAPNRTFTIAVILGSVIGGEIFGASELLPMGVILAGVVAITMAKAGRRKRVPAAPADCRPRMTRPYE